MDVSEPPGLNLIGGGRLDARTIGELRRSSSHGFMAVVIGSNTKPGQSFEDLAWLFTCDSRNRGLIRQGFDEAAVLWKAVRATSGNILEIGRNFGGSTVLLAAAGADREIYSIDNRSHENRTCKDYLTQPENKQRVHLLVTDSRKT